MHARYQAQVESSRRTIGDANVERNLSGPSNVTAPISELGSGNKQLATSTPLRESLRFGTASEDFMSDTATEALLNRESTSGNAFDATDFVDDSSFEMVMSKALKLSKNDVGRVHDQGWFVY